MTGNKTKIDLFFSKMSSINNKNEEKRNKNSCEEVSMCVCESVCEQLDD